MTAFPKTTTFCASVLALALSNIACDPSEGTMPDEGEAAEDTDDVDATTTGEGLFDDAEHAGGLRARLDPVGWVFLPWHSEETPGASECGADEVVTGFDCSGDFCDNVAIECHNFGQPVTAPGEWSLWFEREYSPGWGQPGSVKHGHVCPAGEKMTGIDCAGSYCDDISIECSPAPGLLTHRCQWVGPFSDGDGAYLAPSNEAIQGVWCSGQHCDNKWYLECEVE